MKPEWKTYKIGELGRIVTGKTPALCNPIYFGEKYPFITPSDMRGQKYAITGRCLSEEGAKHLKSCLVPPDSVAVSCIGWQMGKAIMTGKQSVTNQQLNTIIPNEKVVPDFLYYSLSLRRDALLSLGAGTGVRTPILNKTAFSELTMNLPPLETQRKIASILSAYDDLIENNTRRIKILEEMSQMIYREWFVNFRFPGHEQVMMVDSPLGLIPAGWEVVTVEQVICRVSAGKKYDNKTASPTGTVPVLDQGKSGVIGYHNDEPGVTASEENPIIVFANHTCYQRLIQFPFSAIQNVLPFLPSKEIYRNIYWLHWATKDLIQFNDYKGHWPEFIGKELLLPQAEACESFGKFVRPIVKFIYKIEIKNQNLRQTRDLLLPKLISGEVDVDELGFCIEAAL